MPPHELRVRELSHLLEVALSPLLEQQREEVDLEEQVTELVEQLRVVARQRGVGHLVGLLDRVRNDRARRLLAVPRALAPQPLGQLLQVYERLRERGQPVVVAFEVVAGFAHGSGLGVNPTA